MRATSRSAFRFVNAVLAACLIAGAVTASAAEWRKAAALPASGGAEAVSVLVEADPAGLQTLVYKVPAPILQATPQRVRQQAAERLVLGNSERWIESPGKPVVPAIPCYVMLPQGHVLQEVKVKPGKRVELAGTHALEYGESVYRLSDPGPIAPATPDAAIYDADDVYPAVRHEVKGIHVKQGVAYVLVVLYPLEYRPLSGNVAYFETMAVQIVSAPGALESDTVFSPKSAEFAAQFCDNPSTLNTYETPEKPDGRISRAPASPALPATTGYDYQYVIITSTQFRDSTEAPTLWDLIALKAERDVYGTIVTVEEIYANYAGRDNAEKVRFFIRDAYNKWGVEFVLLAGDTGVVPLRTLYCEAYSGGPIDELPSDLYYQCLDGTFDADRDNIFGERSDSVDLFAEVAIGRASAEDPEEIANWVYKTMDFEVASEASSYVTNALMVGEHLGFGGVSEFAKASMEEIRVGSVAHGAETFGFVDNLLPYDDLRKIDWATDTLYDADGVWDTEDLVVLIDSNEFGVINHLGHCNETYWAKLVNINADLLVNTNFIFAYSQGCIPGAFDLDCIAEHLTTSTRNGMFAVVFNSRFGWGAGNSTDGASQRFNRHFWHAYFEGVNDTVVPEPEPRLGKMNAYAHESQAWRIDAACMRWCYYESNLLGDPEVSLKGYGLAAGLFFDRLAYQSDATVGVTAIDPAQLDTVTNVNYTIETRADMGVGARRWFTDRLQLTAIGEDRIFTNAVALTSGVTAVHDDMLIAAYLSVGGRLFTAEAMIDDDPPVITNAYITQVTEEGATVVWLTDEPATSYVIVSNTVPLAGGSMIGTEAYEMDTVMWQNQLWYQHSVVVEGLQSFTRYSVGILSADYAANTSTYPAMLTSTNRDDYLLLVTQRRELVYTQPFDTPAVGWSVTNIQGGRCWEFGAPSYRPNAPHSGNKCWGTVLDGRYPNLANAALVSPPIHVKHRPRLTFWTWYSITATETIGEYRDAGFVEINTGSGWVNVTRDSGWTAGVGLQGESGGWQELSIDLPKVSNTVMRVRFRLESDLALNSAGWYIDDLSVSDVTAPGVHLYNYVIDDSIGGDGDGYGEAGESFNLHLQVFNSDWRRPYTNVTGKVGASASGVSPTLFKTKPTAYGTIEPGIVVAGIPPIPVVFSSTLPAGTRVPFSQSARDIGAGRWTHNFQIQAMGRATIAGRVTLFGAGTPIEGATVTGILVDGTTVKATTMADGTYLLHGNLVGSQSVVRASMPGVYSPSADVTVLAPATGVDFELGGVAMADINPQELVLSTAVEGVTSKSLFIANTNASVTVPLAYSLSIDYVGIGEGWLSVGPDSGLIPAGSTETISVTADARNLFPATYQAVLTLRSNDLRDEDIEIPVFFVVVQAPELVLMEVRVRDQALGDGDGYLEPNETADLEFSLLNTGFVAALGVAGTVSSQTPSINVLQPDVLWSNIPSFTVRTSYSNATVQTTAAGEAYDMTLRVTDTNGLVWVLPFTLGVGDFWSVSGSVMTTNGVPVVGAEVRAVPVGGTLLHTGLTGTNGAYTVLGLPEGDYSLVVLPPAPYDSPLARVESVSSDLTGIDFIVDDWGMHVTPTAIVAQVEFSRETDAQLTVENLGATDGQITFEVKHRRGVSRPAAMAAAPERIVNWAALSDDEHVPGEMIVRFSDGISRTEARKGLEAAGCRIVREFKIIPAALVAFDNLTTGSADMADRLKLDGIIAHAEPNVMMKLDRLSTDPMFSEMYGLRNRRQTGGTLGADINAEKAWDITVGDTNVVVAVIDTGMDINHEDLIANLWTNSMEVYGDGTNDMMPGLPGVDDDGDAFFTDEPEDGFDNDFDGLVDENGIDLRDEDVMMADYDRDGIFVCGPDPVFDPNDPFKVLGDGAIGTPDDDFHDTYLASYDEDEDGRWTAQDLLPFLCPLSKRNDGLDNDGDAPLTAETNVVDGIDNDGDGLIDETGIDQGDQDVMRADYDRDTIPLAGPDRQLGTADDDPDDIYLSQYDLNENGILDEIAYDLLPGVGGVDDDNDRNVPDGGEIDARNGIDDDEDGLIDETGIDLRDQEVMRADYDGDGMTLAGPDGTLGTADDDLDDRLLAAYDKNENGGLSWLEMAHGIRPTPGELGVDDDGDMAADREINPNDGIDNDGDGLVDESGIDLHDVDVMMADYNDNGKTLAGDDGIVGTLDDDWVDVALAAFDDDENGYIDDFHGYNFTVAYNNDVSDGIGHGTHVAGTIGAVANNNTGIVGVAWNVRIMPLKIFSGEFDPQETNGLAAIANAFQALEYALEMKVEISNNSYGWPSQHSWIFEELLREANRRSHVFVAAAGNEGADNDEYDRFPASFDVDNVVSVAATDHNDHLATFSCYGSETVDIAAPGVDILSTIPEILRLKRQAGVSPRPLVGDYELMSGTSMAAPHVAGTVALLKSVAPWATPEMIVSALIDGSRKDDYLLGRIRSSGHLDAYGALRILEPSWIRIDPVTMGVPAGGDNSALVTLNVNGVLPAASEPYEAVIRVRQGMTYTNVPVFLTVKAAPLPRIVSWEIVSDTDGDGYAEPGEQVQIAVKLENAGSQFLRSVSATTTTTTPGATLLDGNLAWPDMGLGAVKTSTDTITVQLDGGVGSSVELAFTVTSGAPTVRTWTGLSLAFPALPQLSLTGTVRNTSGTPAVGAMVEYWGVGSGVTTTDGTGAYSIHGLMPGDVEVRVISALHERDSARLTLAATDAVQDFSLGQPAVTFTNTVDVALNWHNVSTVRIDVANESTDAFTYEFIEMPRRRIALISDTESLTPLKTVLEAMGMEVSNYTNNYELVYVYYPLYEMWLAEPTAYYSVDDAIVFDHDMVILDLSGENSTGRLLLDSEQLVLDEYLNRGGRLVVTGENPLSKPDDLLKLALCGGSTLDRSQVPASASTVVRALPWRDFVGVEPGDTVAGREVYYDLGSTDELPGQATVYVRADAAAKVMVRDAYEGRVYYWAGNPGAVEWTHEGVWQDVLRGIIVTEFAEDVPWMVISSAGQTVADGVVNESVIVNASQDLEVGDYQATILVKGNYTGAELRAIQVDLTVAIPQVVAESRSGVVDWMNRSLAGNGGSTSSVFQLIVSWDDIVNPPNADGTPSGDDKILVVYPTGSELGRFGAGYEYLPNSGRFSELFEHAVIEPAHIYVRAWDGETIASSVAYGESAMQPLENVYGEKHNFGTWTVDKVLGYPGEAGAVNDWNGDSVPDGWYVSQGMDPRLPVQAIDNHAEALAQFGSFGNLPNEMYEPQGLFVTAKFIFVLDSHNNRVQVWNRATNTRVLTYGVAGGGAGQFSQPDDICRDPRAGVYRFAVADTHNNRIQFFTFDPNTGVITYESQLGSQGITAGKMVKPRGVDIDMLGNVYVADTDNNRVQVFNEDRTFFTQFGLPGSENSHFNKPEGICVDEYGTIYVADTGNNRVQIFAWLVDHYQLYAMLGEPGRGDGQFLQPRDVEMGVDDRIFVVDSANHRVQIFHSNYQHLLNVGSEGQNTGQLQMPFGCAPVAGSSLLYVADTRNHRVQLFDTVIDFDGDGLDDLWERDNGLDNTDASDWSSDIDRDGLLAIGEYRLGLNPGNADTDGDEWFDGYELARGFDPGDPQYDILRITGLGVSGGGLSVRYMAEDGVLYRLETRDSLHGGVWVPVAGSEARAAGSGIVSFPYVGGPHAYFQAVKIEE